MNAFPYEMTNTAEEWRIFFLRFVSGVVFKPEVKDVAHQVDANGVFSKFVEHLDEFLLVCPTARNGFGADVCVAYKIDHSV